MEITDMSDGQWAVLFVILGISTFVFIGMLFVGWRQDQKFEKGEMRRAITAFIVTIFGLTVLTSFFPEGPVVSEELQGAFVALVTTILGFYFGTKAGKEQPDPPSGSSPDGSDPGGGPNPPGA